MSWIGTTVAAAASRLTTPVRRRTRYDVVLAVIPAALGVGVLVGSMTAVPGPAAVAAASTVGLLAMVDALFLNPPREPSAGSPSP